MIQYEIMELNVITYFDFMDAVRRFESTLASGLVVSDAQCIDGKLIIAVKAKR